ncbi:MAG: hypothetical protein Q7V62_05420 [Actinomycetota bacterium]|nr:hypothetical protein [Actinomycetota bacterium]
MIITLAEEVEGPAGSPYVSVPETLAVSVLARLATGDSSASSVKLNVEVAPGASAPSAQLAVPLPADVGTAVALENANALASHVSVSGTAASAVSPVLVTAISNVASSPGWICASCPSAGVLTTETLGAVMRIEALVLTLVGWSPYWSVALFTAAVSVEICPLGTETAVKVATIVRLAPGASAPVLLHVTTPPIAALGAKLALMNARLAAA